MITQFNREDYASNLPDAFRKAKGSNNARILEIEKAEADRLREAVRAVYDSLDLDKATGAALDMFGEMYGQERGKATDDQYRVLIRSRILRNMANGDYNSVATAVSLIFGCKPSDFNLRELDEPCAVELTGLPYSILNSSGLGAENAIKIIAALMPAGVRMEAISFEGTFEFGSTANEYDEAKGFGNEDQTTGGYLGLLTSGESGDLPI